MKKPILDETGNARKWIADGRGVVVWESHDIGAGRPDIITPANHVTKKLCGNPTCDVEQHARACAMIDCKPILGLGEAPEVAEYAPSCRKPHWAYAPARVLRSESDALFYAPGRVVETWSDTPAGNKAARSALKTRYKDETREAPIGKIHTTYVLHRFALVAAQVSPEGTTLDEYEAPLAGSEVPAERKRFPTFVAFRVGVRQWSCVDREEG